MARIKKSTNNIIPSIASTICCGGLTLMLGPAAFLLWPVFFGVSKKGMADDIDDLTADDTRRIVDQARRTGQRNVKVSHTIGSNGALFNLPMTRTYEVDFDRD